MPIEQILIIGYFTIILAIGFYRKSSSNINDFLYSGRNLTIPAFVATLVTTWYGGILEIGRFAHVNGISTWLVFGVFYYIAAIIYARFIVDKISLSKNDSIPLKFYKNYGKWPSLIAVLMIFLLASPAPYLKMLAEISSYIFNVNMGSALIFGALFSTIYTLRGGFNAIVKTDMLQFTLMFIGFGYMAIYLYLNFGGYEFLAMNLSKEMLSFPGTLNWTYVFTWGFIALITFIDPSFYQRIYSSKDKDIAKKGIYISIGFWFLFDVLSITVALYSSAILPEIKFSPYIDIAEHILPPLIKGIFIVSMLAIIMSTIDSFTFISGFTIGKDLIQILKQQDYSIDSIRIGIVISGLFSVILASFFTYAVDIWYTVGSFAIPALLIPLLLTYLDIELKEPLICIILPIMSTGLWFLYGSPQLDPMYSGLAISALLCFFNFRKKNLS